jgi:cell division protein FtsB
LGYVADVEVGKRGVEMESEQNWLTIAISSIGGAIIVLCGAIAILYGKVRSVMAQARKDDADANEKSNEVDAKKRKLEDEADERAIAQWRVIIDKLERDMTAMNVELEKRRIENIECMRADAQKAAQIEYLTKAHNEKVEQIHDLQGRLAILEQRARP